MQVTDFPKEQSHADKLSFPTDDFLIVQPTPSLYWYDLETTGLNPAKDRIMQFAGQRTDHALNVVGDPFSTYVRLPPEVAPSPEACMLTGISPQKAATGLSEWDAFNKIHAAMSEPQTCVLGYNSIKFDDEFIRYGLYRNFFDPYEREWQSGNSRSDFINVVRITAALRPEGLNWPVEDGKPTFSLENIASANNVDSEGAHDALVDVNASIGLARKIRTSQPRLWQYALSNDRTRINSFVNPLFEKVFLHTSSSYGNVRYCVAPVLAIAKHPKIPNRVILVDLTGDLDVLLKGSVEDIRASWFTKNQEDSRAPLHIVALNQLPLFAPRNTLTPESTSRIGIDPARVDDAARALRRSADLQSRVIAVLAEESGFPPSLFTDEQLYDRFIPNVDKPLCRSVREALYENLDWPIPEFEDDRLRTLLKILRAHVRPEELFESEIQDYESYVRSKLRDEDAGTKNQLAEIERLLSKPLSDHDQQTLHQLRQYLQELEERYGV